MSVATCIDVPVSWLRLERYHLGESDDAEREAIASHLAACSACAASYASIAQGDAVALPPLPLSMPVPIPRARSLEDGRPHVLPCYLHGSLASARRGRRARIGAMLAGGLALAAAVALGIGNEWRSGGAASPSADMDRVKGNAITFSLVREDSERIEEAGGTFFNGDRFKAIVTCPPTLDVTFDLVVYDEAGASFPLAPARIACGNDVPLPGAFRLSASEEASGKETVCLVWELDGSPPGKRSARERQAVSMQSAHI